MLKRKLMIDQHTVKAYKDLVSPKEIIPAEPIKAPAAITKKRRGSYFITSGKSIEKREGWLMTVDGLEIGAERPTKTSGWYITDIMSGCLIYSNIPRLDAIPGIVRKYADVIQQKRTDKEFIKLMDKIAEAYKAA